ALALSERIAVRINGTIDQLGSPRENYERPATKFVAGFIGTSNLLSGTVTEVTGEQAVIALGEGERILVPLQSNSVRVGDRLELRSEEHTSELQSRENLVCRL